MTKYQKAKPFDFVRDVKDIQTTVKQLQVRAGGQTGPWQQAAMQNSWTGTINFRITRDNDVELSAYQLVVGTNSANIIIASGLPTPFGPHEFNITSNASNASPSAWQLPRATLTTAGNITVIGFVGAPTQVSFEVSLPLDV
jgi:hypothetical protein